MNQSLPGPVVYAIQRFRLRSRILLVAAIAVATLTLDRHAGAENWPGFHGLKIAGVVPEGALPERFLAQEPQWSFDLGTRDVGSIAVQDGSVYLLSMDPGNANIRLISVNLQTGKQNWSREFPQARNHLHARNTLASSTPATDGQHVYIAHSDRAHTWLRCLDHQGNEIWNRDLGAAQSQHGFGTSPTVHGDVVILNFSQQAEQIESGQPGVSKVIAVDRHSGKTIWETPVTSTRVCYGVPVIHDGKVVCANTGDGLYALSLETGEKLWSLPVFSMRCVSSPIIAGDLVMGSSGSGRGGQNHLVAVRMPKDNQDKPTEAFRLTRGAPYVPTSVVHDETLFAIDDKGIATCVDVTTGEVQWSKRIQGTYGASPILIGDKVLVINMAGDATVFRASRTFEELGTVELSGYAAATPAFADGKLLVRVEDELRCY